MRPDYGYISQDSSNTRRSEAAAMSQTMDIYHKTLETHEDQRQQP